MRRHYALLSLAFTLAASTLTACGGSADAKLQFSEAAALRTGVVVNGRTHELRIPADQARALQESRLMADAESFKMKLIAAYLAEDIDENQNNVGQTEMFWLNEECSDDIMSCTTDPTANSGKDEEGNDWRHTISTFFDFSDVTAVNTALNSQGRGISPGTYKYVRVEFCKWQSSASYPNIKWTYNGVENSFSQASCGATAEISPPIEVADGDSVTVTLAYDLTGSVAAGSGSDNCSGGFCFTVPTFTPSASK